MKYLCHTLIIITFFLGVFDLQAQKTLRKKNFINYSFNFSTSFEGQLDDPLTLINRTHEFGISHIINRSKIIGADFLTFKTQDDLGVQYEAQAIGIYLQQFKVLKGGLSPEGPFVRSKLNYLWGTADEDGKIYDISKIEYRITFGKQVFLANNLLFTTGVEFALGFDFGTGDLLTKYRITGHNLINFKMGLSYAVF